MSYHNGTSYCVGDTGAVDSFPSGASPYGALDMAGYVFEWVNDWYASDYCSTSTASNPMGPACGTTRVLRGSSWNCNWNTTRVAHRLNHSPAYRNIIGVGFRCAASPGP